MDRQQGGGGPSSLPDSLHDHIVMASHQPEQSRPGSGASARSSGSHIIPTTPVEPQGTPPADLPPTFPLRFASFRPPSYRPHSTGAGPGIEGLEVEGSSSSSIHHGATTAGVTDPRNYVYRPGSMSVAPTAEARLRPVRSWAIGRERSASPPGDRQVYDLGTSQGSRIRQPDLYGSDVLSIRTDIGSMGLYTERRAGSSDSSPRYSAQGSFILSPVDFVEGSSSRYGHDTFREAPAGYDRFPNTGEASGSRPVRRRTTSALVMQRHRSIPHEGSSTSGRSEYGAEPVPSSASSVGSPSATLYPELWLPNEGPSQTDDREGTPEDSAARTSDPSTARGPSPVTVPSTEASSSVRKGKRRQHDNDDEALATNPDVTPITKARKTKTEVACWFCRREFVDFLPFQTIPNFGRQSTCSAPSHATDRKLRCDGKKPCSNCAKRKPEPDGTTAECTYEPFPRRRGPGKAKKGSKKQTRARSTTSALPSHTPPDPRMVLRPVDSSDPFYNPPGRPTRRSTEQPAHTPPPLTVDPTLLSSMSIHGEPITPPSHRFPPLQLPAPGPSRYPLGQRPTSANVPRSGFTPRLPEHVLDAQQRFEYAGEDRRGHASGRPPRSRDQDNNDDHPTTRQG
ncbi:hypothetical protein NEOLEDRAFT_1180098 [Neolentinus lepideus HHB14362 ss-1]|uniref:Zn(2)-C6 fungal-type domain-containing protein n=1 Tax=Neolentinus lepideus HHB14362 ss-1 TaxID=1314782 RepID=A0A165R895_9AGAM|nr:hypothetical protein NEOLEDRAFT_1180098 [Neolentinus lepideus HHB14362 ss-1]